MEKPTYYVTAGKRNVKLNQCGLSPERPARPYGPFCANDGRSNRLVTVFATDDESCDAILDHWRRRAAR